MCSSDLKEQATDHGETPRERDVEKCLQASDTPRASARAARITGTSGSTPVQWRTPITPWLTSMPRPSIVVQPTEPAEPDQLNGISSLALMGAVNPNGLPTQVLIEHGPTTQYGRTNSFPTIPSVPGGNDPGPAPKPLSIANPAFFTAVDLQAVATVGALAEYHWRMVAKNDLGTTASRDQSVRVRGVPPTLLGDLNSDKVVNANDLKILLDNYTGSLNPTDLGVLTSYVFVFPSFVGMTNVAGLGGTNVTFETPALELLGLRVEYSTDLNK